MEHYYHLVDTKEQIDIGNVFITEDGGDFSIQKPMQHKGVLMLFTNEGKPVFEPNAYIMSRRIVEGTHRQDLKR